MADGKICKIDGCGKPVRARAMCPFHYNRWLAREGAGQTHTKARKGEPLRWLEAHVGWSGEECLTWPFGKRDNGYAVLNNVDGSGKVASRHMCRLAHGDPPDEEYQAAHSCGKGHLACVNPTHLSWKTVSGNMADKVEHGTDASGERNPQSKLTEPEVAFIRQSDIKGRLLAANFGVSPALVSLIRNGRRWQKRD